ncbi:hypothetical protein OC844_003925 [Tilletia horrida]|nr:hypothetical protein OC844_003925 [Tilletia horrida]
MLKLGTSFMLLVVLVQVGAHDFVIKRQASHLHAHHHHHGGHPGGHHQPPPAQHAPGRPSSASPPSNSSAPVPSLPAAHAACSGMSPLIKGCPAGFGSLTRGGGTAPPVYPKTNAELASYLSSAEPQVIVLNREFNFIGSQGKGVGDGCAPWGTAPACQVALDYAGWCDKYEGQAPRLKGIEYDAAGAVALSVSSRKTIVGVGRAGVIRGKGLRIANAEDVILQNVKITEINPRVIWAGDAIDIGGASTSRVWIDHVTISEVGRQMLVMHEGKNQGITVSNVHFDGETPYSNRCNGQHYWTAKISGTDDKVTMMNCRFTHFLGRSPQVGGPVGTSLVHVLNNVWEGSSEEAHAFEVIDGGRVLAEGNFFANVPLLVDQSHGLASLLTVDNSVVKAVLCSGVLGRRCEPNVLENSGPAFDFQTGDVLQAARWIGLPSVPAVAPADAIRDVVISNAGYGMK